MVCWALYYAFVVPPYFMKRLPPPLRKILPVAIVLATTGVFAYFFARHPQFRHALASTDPWVLLLVGALYTVFILCLVWVYDATLRLCGARLPVKENVLLTCYSTIINFFGPLQSGPGVRAAYLKQKHQVKLRDYTLASLVYYALYAVVSALFILVGSGKEWPVALALTACVTLGSGFIVFAAHRRFIARHRDGSNFHLHPALLAELLAATVCQLACMVVIYFVELRAIHTGASLLQAAAYGGAANFALFVSLTPGAIGFREAFLNFSQRLHHISTNNILAASVIDRAVFVAFLGLLFLVVLGLHADRRFRVKLNQPVQN